MFKLLKRYYNLNKAEQKILLKIFFWLIYSSILVRFIPLKWFNKTLGNFKQKDNFTLNENQEKLIKIIIKNINKLKRRFPWKIKCFEEAITAKKILEKNNIKTTLYLGVKKEGNKLKAHAWLKTGNNYVTGEKGNSQFKIVGFYS